LRRAGLWAIERLDLENAPGKDLPRKSLPLDCRAAEPASPLNGNQAIW
jgi:hypothetical protein